MFNPKPSEAEKTQIVIDYLINELAAAHNSASTETVMHVEMMLKIQRKKLQILNRKFRRNK